MTATTSQIATQLRKVADALDAFEDVSLSAYVSLSERTYSGPEAERRQTVDAVAAALGLTPKPEQVSPSYWEYAGSDNRDGVRIEVSTSMKAPARCSCGAECTHTAEAGAA
jgi:hypothetical protein